MSLEFIYTMDCAAALMRYIRFPGDSDGSLRVLGLLNLLFPEMNCEIE